MDDIVLESSRGLLFPKDGNLLPIGMGFVRKYVDTRKIVNTKGNAP